MAAVADRGTELFNAGRYEQALAAFRESAGHHRQQAVGDPGRFEPVLAAELHNIGLCLARLGRYAHAVTAYEEAEQICARYWGNDAGFGSFYAAVSASLAGALVALGRIEQAMVATYRVVSLRRTVAQAGIGVATPAADAELADALRQFVHVRAVAGRELDQAAGAATEAITICERLVEAAPQQFTGELDATLRVAAAVVDARARRGGANGASPWLDPQQSH